MCVLEFIYLLVLYSKPSSILNPDQNYNISCLALLLVQLSYFLKFEDCCLFVICSNLTVYKYTLASWGIFFFIESFVSYISLGPKVTQSGCGR